MSYLIENLYQPQFSNNQNHLLNIILISSPTHKDKHHLYEKRSMIARSSFVKHYLLIDIRKKF